MSELKRLNDWLERQELTDKSFAEALDMDPSYIWRVRKGERPISESFRWRFQQAYGVEMALRLFDTSRKVRAIR